MPDTGYTKERDAPHQDAVARFIYFVSLWRDYTAQDIQNKGYHKWAPDVLVYWQSEPVATVDVKTMWQGRCNITVASDEHNYQLAKEKLPHFLVFEWAGYWRAVDKTWLAEHQIGGDREPTGNGSKTRFRLFGPIHSAPLFTHTIMEVRGQA